MADAIVQADEVRTKHSRTGIEPFSETVTTDQISRMNRKLAKLNVKRRGRIPGIEKRRADIIIAGGLLLETILTEIGAVEITTSDWSLREGVILNYLRTRNGKRLVRAVSNSSDDALFDLHADETQLDVRATSVLSVARRYNYDAPHSHHIARLATRIFDDTINLHKMDETERRLLLYSALLHDIGYHIAHNNHERHSSYLIKNSEMPGFTGAEIAMMAALVRYHRGAFPPLGGGARARRENEDYYALDRTSRVNAMKLAAILQIADGLDRSYRRVVRDVRCEVTRKHVLFVIESDRDADLEIWSAQRKAEWFGAIFQIPVRFERQESGSSEGDAIAVAD